MLPQLSRDAIQNELLKIWQEVLEIDAIQVDDDFFDLGGNSLCGVQVNARIRNSLKVDLLLDVLFDAPTIATLTTHILENAGELRVPDTPAIPVISRNVERPPVENSSPKKVVPMKPEMKINYNTNGEKETTFSLFFFSADGSVQGDDKYKLVLESARLADQYGFEAIWTPERHFGAFGGLYPNPSVLSAAIAMVTNQLEIRAGSVVMSLQNPIRVAEEWSLVDNLSGGRVSIACASGWHTNDFALIPEAYANRKEVMLRNLEIVQRLWRGETVTLPNGSGELTEIRIFPNPIQAKLPIWFACHSEETFIKAGQLGANVVTNLFGEKLDTIAGKIQAYKESLARHGYNPKKKKVSLMVHTYIGKDLEEVRNRFKTAYRNYLEVNMELQRKQVEGKGKNMEIRNEDHETIIKNATERLLGKHGLIGTPESCLENVEFFESIGVDEIACLVDFGIDHDSVIEGIHQIERLKTLCHNRVMA